MRAENMTEYHRADLQRRMAAARDAVVTSTQQAQDAGTQTPGTGEFDGMQKLWVTGGYWAGIFCLWFAFIAPIVLVVTHWDTIR